MNRLVFALLVLPLAATANEPLSPADAAVLDRALPTLGACLEAAAADKRSTDGVIEVDLKIGAKGAIEKSDSQGHVAGPMMMRIDEALRKLSGFAARDKATKAQVRLELVMDGKKGVVTRAPAAGPWINDADGKHLDTLLPGLSERVTKAGKAGVGRAVADLRIMADGKVSAAYLNGAADGQMGHCIAQKLKGFEGFASRP